ncbi:hypothetical protein [Luteibacter sp. ME-Dv--P-043b]|jgi:chromosome segregation ATPase|uniref:hypothetical protein n=1 Tax=unclassified Luteibacter TaxID=2620188 RepID=UPI002553779C|nr:hypothetical protein [Luteibacter sp. ME-Dv--P-043b]
MHPRVVAACLLVSLSPWAMAAAQVTPAAPTESPAAARARLEAAQRQADAENLRVRQLKARVDTLESHSDAAAKALSERDRKIAELQKQLAGQHP